VKKGELTDCWARVKREDSLLLKGGKRAIGLFFFSLSLGASSIHIRDAIPSLIQPRNIPGSVEGGKKKGRGDKAKKEQEINTRCRHGLSLTH